MTTANSTVPTLLVATGISKHRHELLIGIPGRKRRRRLTIRNTLEDIERLARVLSGYDHPVRIGFEATVNYHRPLAHHLGQAGFGLKLVSSVALARTRETLHNSWDKNDPKDAHPRAGVQRQRRPQPAARGRPTTLVAEVGVRKVWRRLGRKVFDVARCTVARLMKDMRIQGIIRGKPHKTTIMDKEASFPVGQGEAPVLRARAEHAVGQRFHLRGLIERVLPLLRTARPAA